MTFVAVFTCAVALVPAAHGNGPARPLVVVFTAKADPSLTVALDRRVPPAPLPPRSSSTVPSSATVVVTAGDEKGKKNEPLQSTPAPASSAPVALDGERAVLAARAVRDVLRDSAVVDASLYSPDAPTFLLAIKESKLIVTDLERPSPAERVAIGRAVGATYVIGVIALQSEDAGKGADVEIYATEVSSNKTWAFRAQSWQENGGGVGSRTIGTDGRPGPYQVSLLSAANTVVTRFLAGPMGDYTRATPPSTLLPPKPADASEPDPPVAAIASPPAATPAPRTGTVAAPPPSEPVAPIAPVAVPNPPPALPRTLPQNPPILAPPVTVPAAPTTTAVPEPSPQPVVRRAASAADTEAIRRQADALIASGDVNTAISTLRRGINQAPRDARLRAALVKAYLAAGQTGDAAAEAKRGLGIAAPDDRDGRLELTRLLAQGLSRNGDTTAARVMYQETIEAEPSAVWARIALADLLVSEGQTVAAEAQLQAARKIAPDDADVSVSLARLLAQKGDYNGALAAITSGANNGGDAAARSLAARSLFDDGAKRVANLLAQNRVAWEAGTLSREAFYKATAAQSERATALLALLKAVPPPAGGPNGEVLTRAHKRRVFAAALLSQSVAAMVTFLETGKESDGVEARLLLTEFQKELDNANNSGPTDAPSPGV